MDYRLKRYMRRRIQSKYATIERLHPWCRLLIVALYFFSFYCVWKVVHYVTLKNHTMDAIHLETASCPACYGISLCQDLKEGVATYQGITRFQFLNFIINRKNVNYGLYRENPVIFKKLASDVELEIFDEEVKDEMLRECVEEKLLLPSVPKPEAFQDIGEMFSCPSSRLIQDVFYEGNHWLGLNHEQKSQLVTSLLVNQEPVIFQTFPLSEGWPFPQYYGACGRYVVVENAGKPLSRFYHAPWKERAKYALDILKIADQFTSNSREYMLYFSTMDYDHFAVNEKGQVKVIDAENIIVVDKQQVLKDKPLDYNIPHASQHNFCDVDLNADECTKPNRNQLCTRVVSDYNIYSVCRQILSFYTSLWGRGILHDVPKLYDDKYQVSLLLQECVLATKNDRFQTQEELIRVLAEIVSNEQ